MDLTKILSISGRHGLFKVISQGKNAVIVESLTDGRRMPVFANERMSTLEEISIFTTGEDRSLKEVLKAFHEKMEGKPGPDPRVDNNALVKQFAGVIPDYDPERVYVSDMRKIIAWYNQLLEKELLDFTEEPAAAEVKSEGEKSEEDKEEIKEKKIRKPVKPQVSEHAPGRPVRTSKGKSGKTGSKKQP
jgi:hypothetical protein